jgi:hypothetical protein
MKKQGNKPFRKGHNFLATDYKGTDVDEIPDKEFKEIIVLKKSDWGTRYCVIHACNPCYLGGRGQENHDFRPAQAKSS